MSAARAALVREVARAIREAPPCEYDAVHEHQQFLHVCPDCVTNAARAAIRAVGEACAKACEDSPAVGKSFAGIGALGAAARIRDLTGAGDA